MNTSYYDELAALGYALQPTYAASPRILKAENEPWENGDGIDTPCGLQPDGSYLAFVDLDEHCAGQDAAEMLAYVLRRAGPELDARLPIRRSLHVKGRHLPFRYHRPIPTVKVYDPRQPDRHVGELIGEGCRLTLTGEWLQGSPATIPLLTTIELMQLLSAIHAPGALGSIEGHETPKTTRSDRLKEGKNLIAGWATVRGWQTQLDTLLETRPMLEKRRDALRTEADRSKAYGNFVQSLMLHAAGLGTTVEGRCKVVAAMAIGTGAGGKEQDSDYSIERDTAVLIAKIVNGDAMVERSDGTIPHWITPRWVNGYVVTTSEPEPEPVKRPAHRPTGDRAKMVKRLEKLIRRWLEDSPSGRIYYYAADLADDLGCSPRSVTNYLADLADAGKIKRGQLGGAGGRAYFDVLPAFWHANNSAQAAENEAKPVDFWHASPMPEQRVPTPETAENTVQCNKVGGAPKPCAPAAPEPFAPEVTWDGIEEEVAAWEQSPEGRRWKRWEARQIAGVVQAQPLPAGFIVRPPGRLLQRWRLYSPDGKVSWHATEGKARWAALGKGVHAATAQGFGAPFPATERGPVSSSGCP